MLSRSRCAICIAVDDGENPFLSTSLRPLGAKIPPMDACPAKSPDHGLTSSSRNRTSGPADPVPGGLRGLQAQNNSGHATVKGGLAGKILTRSIFRSKPQGQATHSRHLPVTPNLDHISFAKDNDARATKRSSRIFPRSCSYRSG